MEPLKQKREPKKEYRNDDIPYLSVVLLELIPSASRGLPYDYRNLLKMEPKQALGFLRPIAKRLEGIFEYAKPEYERYFLSHKDWLRFRAEKTLIDSLLRYFTLSEKKLPIPSLIDRKGIIDQNIDLVWSIFKAGDARILRIMKPFKSWLGE